LYTVLHTLLVVMSICCRQECVAAKLTALQMYRLCHCTQLSVRHIQKYLKYKLQVVKSSAYCSACWFVSVEPGWFSQYGQHSHRATDRTIDNSESDRPFIWFAISTSGRSEGSQTRQTVKYGHDPRGTRNQESLCWRGPAAIYESVRLHVSRVFIILVSFKH
jgi:hypothetical protein